ncbi:cysteine-rich receptor-like protein kinase 2 [Quercus suber]|uniref:Cysteine-rich receptor-like protein kinase 2 n=1 Tax=Quercus suber TaxID=58331 RepID=A0AAW0K6X6_QUESU
MKKEFPFVPSLYLIFLVTKTLLILETAMGDPRSQIVKITCGNQQEHNVQVFVHNSVATMKNISNQMGVSGFGLAVSGSGPDTIYGLAQCYGDLSLSDCVLCYAEISTVLPQCFLFTSGRIYLDGCFMRSANYSFFQEYTGPGDRAICGSTTRKNSTYEESVRQAVSSAVLAAPNQNGYATARETVPGAVNEAVYVLANCWRTLNANSCKACLENASASILECLPWSEGRALNTGCFMRYSDKDFLNKKSGNGNSKGTNIVIAVSVASSVVLLVVGVAIGFYIWKHRYIQKKRKGSNDTERLTWKHFRSGTVEQLYDPNLMLYNHYNVNVKNEILRVLHIGLLCTQEIQSLRPTMSKALQMLTNKDYELPAPTNPPFIDERTMELTDICEDPCYPLRAGYPTSIATISEISFYPR